MENENRKLPVEFFYKTILVGSEEARKYEDRIYIRFYVSKLSIFEREAKEEDFEMHSRAWGYFQRIQAQKESGLSISMLPISGADIEGLKELNIFTIEALTSLVISKEVIERIGDKIVDLQNTAKAFMQQSTTDKVELDKAREKIALLEKEIERLKNDNSINSAGGGGHNTAVRETANNNKQPKQGNKAKPSIS